MLNGQPLALDTPFTVDDVQYPANWLRLSSPEEKLAIGITEVPDPPPFDDRFYWGPGLPKDLNMLKATWLGNVNQIAYTLLAPSDWMVTRKTEVGTAILADWGTYRAQVRADCTLNKDNLTKATDIDSFVAIATNLTWPVAPDAKV